VNFSVKIADTSTLPQQESQPVKCLKTPATGTLQNLHNLNERITLLAAAAVREWYISVRRPYPHKKRYFIGIDRAFRATRAMENSIGIIFG